MDNNQPFNMGQWIGKCGLIVGAYYIVRFACIPVYQYLPAVGMIYLLMLAGAPFFTGFITMITRERKLGGVMTFKQGFTFSLSVMIFGSIIEAAGIYIYFRFMDNGQFVKWLSDNVDSMASMGAQPEFIDEMAQTVATIGTIRPIEMAISTMIDGIFLSIIIAIIIATMLRRKTPRQII